MLASDGLIVGIEIPLHNPWIGEPEEEALLRVFRTGNLAGNGTECRAFEADLQQALSCRRCLVLSSATAALEIAMRATGVEGGEVIVPSFTFPSIGNAIVLAGARPVFCEVREPDLNLDVEHALSLVTPATRAIVLTHYAGHPVWIDDAPVQLIEDAAHALGSVHEGRACGTLGAVGCISFHQTKNLVTGEGGALLTDSDEVVGLAEVFREKGTNRQDMLRGKVDLYSWVGIGSSHVMPELAAAIGRAQLVKLEAITSARRRVAEGYDERLRGLVDRGLVRIVRNPGPGDSCHHIYAVLVAPDRRRTIIEALREDGIGAASHFVPLHSSPFGRKMAGGQPLPATDRLAASVVRLPIWPGLDEVGIDRVCASLERAVMDR